MKTSGEWKCAEKRIVGSKQNFAVVRGKIQSRAGNILSDFTRKFISHTRWGRRAENR